jgi:hypothetical protein
MKVGKLKIVPLPRWSHEYDPDEYENRKLNQTTI